MLYIFSNMHCIDVIMDAFTDLIFEWMNIHKERRINDSLKIKRSRSTRKSLIKGQLVTIVTIGNPWLRAFNITYHIHWYFQNSCNWGIVI